MKDNINNDVLNFNTFPDFYTKVENYRIKRELLLEAILTNNEKSFDEALKDQSLDILKDLKYEEKFMHAIHLAAKLGQVKIIKKIIDLGVDVNLPNEKEDNMTALHHAIKQYTVQDSFYPIFYVPQRKYQEVVKLLLKYGADSSLKITNGYTALHLASKFGQTEEALELVKVVKDINEKDMLGNTALHFAVSNNNIKLTEILISHGADVNVINNYKITPLHIAVIKNSEIVEVILKAKGDIDAKNNVGEIPFYKAAQFKCKESCKVIIKYTSSIKQVIEWMENNQKSKDMVKEILTDFLNNQEFKNISLEKEIGVENTNKDKNKKWEEISKNLKLLHLCKYFIREEPAGELNMLAENQGFNNFILDKALMILGVRKNENKGSEFKADDILDNDLLTLSDRQIKNNGPELIADVWKYIYSLVMFTDTNISNEPEIINISEVKGKDAGDNIEITGDAGYSYFNFCNLL